MSKQYNTRDNFEDVYLRSRYFAKALASLSSDQANKYLSDPDFNRCIAYAARLIVLKNKMKLANCGFDEGDVKNITLVYGLTFMAIKPELKSFKETSLLLFRFVSQRWTNFFIRLDIKFFNNDRLSEYYIGQGLQDQHHHGHIDTPGLNEEAFGQEDAELMALANGEQDLPENYSRMEQIGMLEEQIEELTLRKEQVEKTKTKAEAKLINHKFLHKRKALKAKIRELKRPFLKERKILRELKSELQNNIGKYTEQLAYLATSKHTSVAVRKKAQQLCKKHAINYIAWAQDYIEKKDVNLEHFISLK